METDLQVYNRMREFVEPSRLNTFLNDYAETVAYFENARYEKFKEFVIHKKIINLYAGILSLRNEENVDLLLEEFVEKHIPRKLLDIEEIVKAEQEKNTHVYLAEFTEERLKKARQDND